MLTYLTGIVPRAATALFEKLNGPSTKPIGSQLRQPKRYSALGQPAASTENTEKSWQMKATYVEVNRVAIAPSIHDADTNCFVRYIMSSFETFSFLNRSHLTNETPSQYARTLKAAYC